MNILPPRIEKLIDPGWAAKNIEVSVARLDEIHPQVSGNKYYKLRGYLNEFQDSGCRELLTFGGAFSNHLHAFAFATHELGIKGKALIRGRKPARLSPTLENCINYGVELEFLPRSVYTEMKNSALSNLKTDQQFFIPEGGFGEKGAEGAEQIYTDINGEQYTHFVAACGTGTTVSGILHKIQEQQKILGISVLKGYHEMEANVLSLAGKQTDARLHINHDYSFGGYAKFNSDLINFINEWFRRFEVPSDIVYTGKLFYAVNDLIEKNHFPTGSKIMVIHSGGLQGNRSLPTGTLIF